MSYIGFSKYTNGRVNALETSTNDLDTRVSGLRTEVDDHETRVANVETWVTNNTDEISKEVDKAINDRVTQTAYDATVAQLNAVDSSLNQAIAQTITEGQAVNQQIKTAINTDNAKIENAFNKLYQMLTIIDSVSEIRDPSGNIVDFSAHLTAILNANSLSNLPTA